MVNPWAIICGIGLLAAVWVSGMGYGTHRSNQRHEVDRLKSVEKARVKELDMARLVFRQQEVRDADTVRINDRLADALRRLRDRPDRMPAPAASACVGASGAELSRPDAEFLAGEAARADRLRSDLETCRQWIETVTKGTP